MNLTLESTSSYHGSWSPRPVPDGAPLDLTLDRTPRAARDAAGSSLRDDRAAPVARPRPDGSAPEAGHSVVEQEPPRLGAAQPPAGDLDEAGVERLFERERIDRR